MYPFPEHQLNELKGLRARDVLAWCQRFQRQCAAAGKIIDALGPDEELESSSGSDARSITNVWTQAIEASDIEFPDGEDELLGLVAHAISDCAVELGLTSEPADASRDNLLAMRISLCGNDSRRDIVIGLTNRDPRAGAFGAQLAALRKAARGATPVAVRRGGFPRGVASERAMTALRTAGGRCVSLDDATLRTLIVARRFQPAASPEHVLAWRQTERPISSLPVFTEILDLARKPAASSGTTGDANGNHAPAGGTHNDHADEPAPEPPPPKRRARAASQNRRRQPAA